VSAFSTFGGGSSLNWLAGLLGREVPELLDAAGHEPAGARGLVCVPTLAGGTVAEGGSEVRGSFSGLDLGHGAGTLTRAVLEGIAFSLGRTAELLAEHVELPDEILAVGGGARSALLLQSLADVLGRRVIRVANDQQSAALGAAVLGFLGVGVWQDTTPLDAALQATESFSPDAATQSALAAARQAFDAAAEAAKAEAPGLSRARRASTTHPEEHHAPDHR
jgi:xylulokinase